MKVELAEAQVRVSNGLIELQLHDQSYCVMDGIRRKRKMDDQHQQQQHQRKVDYHRTLSQGKGSSRRLLAMPASYFSLESLLLLLCLTASLLILPLILPPLPPPPFMLLLVPIGILGVLMILAFMPSHARDVTYTYV
ncbi:protein AUXIN-REGULATED GENE INVOLVED IN ORGAN SIZE [Ziziphus jujuba]|uniref:Protein AUXIN-REGULATED GENE INVOLVED IN ORGAN SIZE n=2 Tax=Ziziphus jujuba TaxID=326968 RepID=A0A6P3YVN6_ZIZJJ|nr:protein AUXIN-REGULATED GENE INVOLVED IN ORGAN SIZE [Ziziphus jujuba]XP_048325155.1 protein AUXIN-REGULATED GENE INVOLVED IN ORGAN SIZE [Ziziphus jujuba]KAH7547655.1 hypothetical protein FEM48_Zijuj01G0332900 [Ziziphus jujuba var. spinosa]